MARNIKPIDDGLGAQIIGQVSSSGGASGAELTSQDAAANGTDLGLIGSLHEGAELLDAIVETAMRIWHLKTECPRPDDFAALESMTISCAYGSRRMWQVSS